MYHHKQDMQAIMGVSNPWWVTVVCFQFIFGVASCQWGIRCKMLVRTEVDLMLMQSIDC